MIDTIIFDLWWVILNRWLRLFSEHLVNNYDLTNQKIVNIFIKKYCKLYFLGKISEQDFWFNSLKDLNINEDWKKLKNILLNYFQLNNCMMELIIKLKKNNYKLALLSDQAKDWWIFLNNKFWIEKYFDQSILSFEVWTKKPELDIYKITLQKVWSKAQNSIFIDDLESNLIPAKKLWIKTILFEDCEKLKNDLYLNKINL